MSTELNLNPPLTHVPIGTERSITLYTGETRPEQLAALFDDSISQLFINTIGHTSIAAIGCYNNFYGFFIARESPSGPVYSFNMLLSPDKLIMVADTIGAFYEIVLLINKAWEPFRDKALMPQNTHTKNRRDDILRSCKTIAPAADVQFWESLAFDELAIGLE